MTSGTPRSRASCTIVVSSRIALVTAEPYLRTAVERGVDVWLCAPRALLSSASDRFPLSEDRLLDLEAIATTRRRLKKLHSAMILMLASPKLTRSHLLLNDPRSVATNRTGRLLRRVAKHTARLHPRQFNRLATTVLRLFHGNPFPTDVVIAVSFCSEPHLLTGRGMKISTIVESWDHPMKKPAGYTTDTVVGWNDDISGDWAELQGARRSVVGYPIKLAYAFTGASSMIEERTSNRRRAMYAVGTSSNSDRSDHYRGELDVIEQVCIATQLANWELLIKPKPNGRTGDFDEFEDRYPHVTIGTYRDAPTALDYDLDDEYNKIRRDELESCDLVINCWTTFGLDAAAAGVPVLQLDLREFARWPAIARGSGNYHLANYLVGLEHAFRPDPARALAESLAVELGDPFPRAKRFTGAARSWVTPEAPIDSLIDDALDTILDRAD